MPPEDYSSDLTKEHRAEVHEAAFREGAEAGRRASFWDRALHSVGRTVTVLVQPTSEKQSWYAGYDRSSGGGVGGGSGNEDLVGIGLGFIFAPLFAMFLVGKGILLSIERRSVAPLLEGIAGACACVGIFCTVFGIIWAICLLLAGGVNDSHGLRSQAAGWNQFFWGIAITAWAGFALVKWLQKERATESTHAEVRISSHSSMASKSSTPSNVSSGRGKVAGWVAGVSFAIIAPRIVGSVVIALFPGAANWTLHPLLILPVLFVFPVGPAILIGRAVARHVDAKQ